MTRTVEFTERVLIVLGLLALFILFGLLLKSAVQVLLLIFAGMLFAIFIRGLSRFLTNYVSLPERLVISLVFLFLFLSVSVFFILLAPQLIDQTEKLTEQIPEAVAAINERTGSTRWLEKMMQSGGEGSDPLSAAGKLTTQAFGIFATTLGAITGLFVILFIGLYLSFSPRTYLTGLLHLIPRDGRKRANQVFQALDHTLSYWLIGRFVGMLVVAVPTFFGLLVLNVPLSLSLAVLAGLLTFIPNIGPILAAVPAVLLAFTQSPTTALWVIALYVLIQAVESYIITPLIQQRTVDLPPVLTLSSQILLGSMLGFLGLLLATPLTAAALVLVKMLYVEGVLDEQANVEGVQD